MDNFENNTPNIPETPTGELNGFDSVSNTEPQETPTPVNDGFYTKPKEDIIQDNPNFEAKPYTETYTQPQENNYANYNTAQNSYNNGFRQPHVYSTPKPKKEKKHFSLLTILISCTLALVIGALSGSVAGFVFSKKGGTTKTITMPNNNVSINVEETAETIVEAVAQKVTPSVVGIRTTVSVMNFFGGTSEASGDGSGVIYSSEGYIVTNYHVIADNTTGRPAEKIEVYLDTESAEAFPATLVGYNISADIAVLKINATGLPAVEIADSDKLKVGQYVITVGNPGGLEFMDSVTYGVISGLNRVVSTSSGIELIQTDAAINPGNSGGALVNSKGELVGINSSKIVSEEFEGMGFAIPSNTVVKICENIISKENSPEPYVGISISEKYTSQVLDYYGYPAGAVVLSVAEGSPADDAGIEKGDIITKFGDIEIKEYTMLEDAVKESSPGDTVTVKLYRDGKYYTAKLKVSSNNAVS